MFSCIANNKQLGKSNIVFNLVCSFVLAFLAVTILGTQVCFNELIQNRSGVAACSAATDTSVANFAIAAEGGDKTDSDVQDELNNSVNDAINDTDFSQLEDYFAQNEQYYYNIFGVNSYKEFLQALVSGQLLTDFDSVFAAIMQTVKQNIVQILSPLLLIMVVVLLGVVFKNVKPKVSDSSVASAIFFICFSVTTILVIYLVGDTFVAIRSSIAKMQNQMNAIFPILLLFMTSAGGAASVKAYQPLVLILSNVVSNIFLNVLLPIVVILFVLGIVGGLSPKTKLKKLSDFFNSLFKWIVGLVFTIYMGFMSIQGITASHADGVSIKAAKYAIKNYIPMLGGYISEGFEVARVGSLIIKNAVGFSGIILLLITIVSPVLLLGVMQLAFKLAAGLLEPIADSKTSDMFSGVSKSLTMLMVVLVGVAIMYFVVIFLIICSLSGVG